jgi:hypothetical protein
LAENYAALDHRGGQAQDELQGIGDLAIIDAG